MGKCRTHNPPNAVDMTAATEGLAPMQSICIALNILNAAGL